MNQSQDRKRMQKNRERAMKRRERERKKAQRRRTPGGRRQGSTIGIVLGIILGGIAVLIVLLAVLLLLNGNRNKVQQEELLETDSPVTVIDVNQPEEEPDPGIGQMYYAPLDEKHVAGVENSEMMFVDNEVLIIAEDGVRRDEIAALAERWHAEITGEIEITGDYQLRFAETMTKEQLDALIAELEQEPTVRTACLNYVTNAREQAQTESVHGFFYGEKWRGDLQKNDDNKGKSWGLELINTIDAWRVLREHEAEVHPVRVGLIDSGFDTSHQDLHFAEVFYENGSNGYTSSKRDHGTHVAGTMAAKTNDNTGICGVYPYGEYQGQGMLYGSCLAGANNNNANSLIAFKVALAELICRNVKIINISWGWDWSEDHVKNVLGFEYTDYKEMREELANKDWSWHEQAGRHLADFLSALLDKGYDFVLVQSAGNYQGDAKYSWYSTFVTEEYSKRVYDRIIVVGAIDYKKNVASYSCTGNRVDIYAPGGGFGIGNKMIYSTTANSQYGSNEGTSMAAPHVAGVAAMVWSINSSLKGDEVKHCVCEHRNDDVADCKTVDAAQAVNEALTYHSTLEEVPADYGIICGSIFNNREDQTITLNNTTNRSIVKICAVDTETGEKSDQFDTDFSGHYEMIVAPGTYHLQVSYSDGSSFLVKREYKQNGFLRTSDEPLTITVRGSGVRYEQHVFLEGRYKVATVLDSQTHERVEGSKIFVDGFDEPLAYSGSHDPGDDIYTPYALDGSEHTFTVMADGYLTKTITAHIADGLPCDQYSETVYLTKDTGTVLAEQREEQTQPDVEGSKEDIEEDELQYDKALEDYLDDSWNDYDYGIPLEDTIAWMEHDGHYYALYDYNISAHIMNNIVTAISPKVHLVTIGSQDEQDAVEELIAAGGRNAYLTGGLVDDAGALYWISGEGASYSHWMDECPMDYGTPEYQDIVVIWRGAEYEATDDPDFGLWAEILESDLSYLDFFDSNIDGITFGIILEWDDPTGTDG